jgi:hypothetical protein
MLMFPLKARLKILTRIAQQATVDDPTIPKNAPNPAGVIAPPPTFRASDAWGWMNKVYNPFTVTTINNLVTTVSTALHYASNGQFNFQALRNDGFQVDSSGVPSIDTKNLLNLAILIYKTLLNSGNQFPQKATPDQVQDWNKKISSSQSFLNLSQINPTGQLAQKMPVNIKESILSDLRYLAMYNPIQQK